MAFPVGALIGGAAHGAAEALPRAFKPDAAPGPVPPGPETERGLALQDVDRPPPPPSERVEGERERAPISGETADTARGKSRHAQKASRRLGTGDFDMVNEPFRGLMAAP